MTGSSLATATPAPLASPLARLAAFRLRLDWEVVLYILLIAGGGALRFWDLGARALHHDESLHATYGWYLFNGAGWEHTPMMHGPFQFFGRAFFYVLFGVSDYSARMLDAFSGTLLIAAPLLLRNRLGRTGTLAAVAFLALSPTMLYFSRFAREDIHVGLWTLGLVICLWRYIDEGRHRWLYFAAGLLALSFATKETTYLNVAVFLIFLDLWVAHSLTVRARQLNDLDSLSAACLFILLVPFAWLVVALRPFLSQDWRKFLGADEMPRQADLLLVLGALSAPQLAAFVQEPFKWFLGWNDSDFARQMFTINLGPLSGAEKVTREEFVGFFTVVALIAGTVAVGLRWNPRSWLIAGAIFYVIYGLLYTTLLTNPDGFGSGIWSSLDYWLEQQDVRRGGQPFFYYLLLLPIYEFLPLIIALPAVAYYFIRGNAFARFLAFWLVAALFGYSYAGEKMPWLTVHLALPVIMLAAYTLNQMWTAAQEREWRFRLPPVAWPLAAAALGVVAMAFGVFGPSGAVGARIFVGLAAALVIAALTLTLRNRMMALMPVAAIVGALLVFSVRAAWMASFASGDGADAREMLVYTQSTPDIPKVMRQIEAWSAQTGLGLDLPIDVDSTDAFTWPWAWYLRNYRQVQFPTMNDSYQPRENAVILVNVSNDAAIKAKLADDYGEGQPYHHRWWFPEVYRNIEFENGKQKPLLTTFRDFLASLGDGDTWQTWWHYWQDRQLPEAKGSVDAVAYFPREFAPTTEPVVSEPLAPPQPEEGGRLSIGTTGTAQGLFIKPTGLAVDQDGNLYVVDSGNNRIQKFDRDGRFLAEVGGTGSADGQFSEPWGVAVDAQGNVYVADTWNHRIQKFDKDLNYVAQWGRPALDLNNPQPYDFWGPRDVTVDAEGNVWVTDTGNSRVLKFDPSGQYLATLGGPGSEPGKLRDPVGIEVAANGDVYVADGWNSRIQKFDKDLQPVAAFPVPGWLPDDPTTQPYLALLPDGDIVTTDPAHQRLLRLKPDGSIGATYEGLGDKALVGPTGVAVSGDFLFVSSSGNDIVRRLPLSDLTAP
jgi:predicted membrane-bound mannosyltransferase/sugar lactone lactonase YvrE